MLLEESFIRHGVDLNLPNSIDDLIHSAIQVLLREYYNYKDEKATLCITECTRKRFEEFREKSPSHFAYIQSLQCISCNHQEPLSSFKCVLDIAKRTKWIYVDDK